MKSIFLFLLSIHVLLESGGQTTSPNFDQAWASQFQTAINNAITISHVKGTSVAIFVPDQGTFIGVGGESYAGIPITSDMQFCIGSNTKLFTAVLILKLQESGLLSLNDPLSMWLPNFPYVAPTITIRQLLTHQSGIFDVTDALDGAFFQDPNKYYSPLEAMAAIQPPYFPPGEKYTYSNTNYLLAAMISESVTGKSFAENLHQYIFDPLSLDSTFLSVYETPNGNVAHGWFEGVDWGTLPMVSAYSAHMGSGAIYSTANEMKQWYDHLFNGNFISAASLREITDFDPTSFYGMGLNLNSWKRGNVLYPNWIHSGAMLGFTSQMGYDVKTKSIIGVLANDDNAASVLFPLIIEIFDKYPKKQNDAGIDLIMSPISEQCTQVVAPKVQVKNFGTTNLTSVTFNYRIDGGPVSTFNWSGNLAPGVTSAVTLPVIKVSSGKHKFICYTSSPNGQQEGYDYNNGLESTFYVNDIPSITSLSEGFEGEQFPPTGWNIKGDLYDWKKSSLLLLTGKGSVVKNNSLDNSGRNSEMELPLMDLSNMNNPVLSFNYAYGYLDEYEDGLAILVSTNCGESYHSIFQKTGKQFKTADTNDFFFPNDNQWRLKAFNLSAYKDKKVFIKFRAINGNGSQLYLDNINVIDKVNICPSATNLDALQITSSSAKLNWQFNGSASKFDIYYRPFGNNVWLQLSVAGNKKWVIINNLLPGTDYDWYIVATCTQGTSLMSEVSLFTTDQLPATVAKKINEQDADMVSGGDKLKIYPNPASSSIFVSFLVLQSHKASFTIYDMNGKLIKILSDKEFYKGSHQIRIDTKGFSSGLYILKYQTDQVVLTRKILIVN